ncbi:hypothetical protein J437_LFUL000873 [Ladona fulva]|uniref:PID domain-containing protein n=1 Tax=Ladona fulva TaxID=123851 RepID=A0A8K0NWC2_LADFU|nr:hypothetical protein J437_LFUL000873 [Ladona fulva]
MDASSHHHRLAGLYEFRLQSSREDSERMTTSAMMAVTASSVCSDQQSFYKQRIDSMFDETRSSVSGGGTPTLSRRGRTVLDDLEEEDEEEYDDDKTPNTVQERIQKMFADVTEDEENIRSSGGEIEKSEDEKKGNSSAPKTAPKSKSSSSTPATNQTFSVHYLGSAPLPNRDATLQALQSPLKTLYFKYRKLEMSGRAPPLNGTLEISEKGLRVKMSRNGLDSNLESEREMDKLNKFPSIAVWAAVKFVSRKAEEDKENSTKYAFLPLIADPEGRDKSTLFQDLPEEEINYSCGAHSPMFAIVMRRSSKSSPSSQSVKKTLHCHAFVCACSEDAIVMAANLYQALVAGMSGSKKDKTKTREEDLQQKMLESSEGPRNRQETRNSIKKAMSIDGGDIPGKSLPPRPSDVMSSASAPVRPPRRKKGSNRYGEDARSTNSEDLLSVEEDDEIRFPLSPISYRPNISSSLASLQSKKNSTPKEQSGDIFTKIAIPRTGSFLDHGAAVRRSSSMGLRDLFQEVRAQEGLTSLDDILEKIVDADGMSFARLKPLYREFLLKLAATLSRDELYQRSKNIMRRQASSRRRRRRKRVGASATRELSKASRMDGDSSSTYGDGVACTGGKFSWALCSSVSKMKPKSSKASREDEGRKRGSQKNTKSEEGGEGTSCNFEFTSVIFPSEERPTRPRAGSSSISSSLSSASRASKSRRQKRKQFHAHRPSFNAGRSIRGSQGQITRSASNHSNKENQSRPKVSTSEDSSDFFSFKRRSTVDTNTKSSSRLGSLNGTGLGGGRSSSGYVSCSDCSFDSESCNSDKCYCPQEPHKKHPSSRLRRKESMRSRRCGEHCRNVEMSWCCCEAARNVPACRARVGIGYSCGYRGACEGARCATAAYKCQGHGKPSVHQCDRCSGVRRCSCESWRNMQCTENPHSARMQCEKRGTKVGSSGGDCLDEDDWEDEDAAVVVEDGASATSSSSWRPGAAVPKSRMDVYATLPPPRPLPEAPAKGSSGIYDRSAKKKHEVTCRSRSSGMDVAAVDMKQQKVLVVSARDPRGRVICMGRGDQPTLPPVGGRLVLPSPLQRCSKSTATEALSVKKSAEIAALFSDDKSNQRTEVVTGEEVVYTTLEPPKPSQIKGMKTEFISKRGYYSKSSLENTLGYLP